MTRGFRLEAVSKLPLDEGWLGSTNGSPQHSQRLGAPLRCDPSHPRVLKLFLGLLLAVAAGFCAMPALADQTQQAPGAAATETSTEKSANGVTAIAAETPADEASEQPDVPAGHSQHGEAFNAGPRQKAYLMEGTGKVRFQVSTKNPMVQKFVEQGIGQLHGFWYFEAERSFRQAAMLDPDCAIAYWGMAMANRNNSKRSKGFLAEAAKRKDKAGKLEGMFIDALNEYVNSTAKRKEKAKKYVAAFEKMVEEFPDDVEARAFYSYALYRHRSVLKREYADVEKAIQDVLALEPRHPVHHYRIHLWDYKNPSNVLNSAAVCGQASPAIAHMWHMPGHIYSRLKRYNDAVWQQEASARVDHAHMMRDRVMPDQIHNFAHNNEWLIRNLNYIGRWRDGVDLAKNMISLPRHPRYNTLSRRGSTNYGRLRLFEVLSRFEMWDELISLCQQPYLEPTERETEQVKRLRHLGIAYVRSGDVDKGREVLTELERRLTAAKAKAKKAADAKAAKERANPVVAKRPKQYQPKKSASQRNRRRAPNPVAIFEKAVWAVKGHLAVSGGDYKTALDLFKKAGEDALYRARVQSLAGEKEAAVTAAAAYLKSRPNQVQPLAGQIEILWMAGKREEAKKKFAELREISSSIQFGTPVFERLKPVANDLGLPSDWRVAKPHPDDFGKRPALDSLGPFRWRPMPAPDWVLKDTSGKSFQLKQYRGKPVVVIFYLGFGCLHCAEQLQAFAPMAQKFHEAGISLIAISTDNQADLKKSIDDYPGGMPFPLVSDEKLDVFKAYRAFDDFEKLTLHGTFLIDGDGLVLWQDISYEPFMDPNFVLTEAQRLLAQKVGGPYQNLVAGKPAGDKLVASLTPTVSKPITPIPQIRAAGIDGSLILSGPGETPKDAIKSFLYLAKRKLAKIVVLRVKGNDGGTSTSAAQQILEHWEAESGTSFQVLRIGTSPAAPDSDVLAALAPATGVWFDGGTRASLRQILADRSLAQQLQQLLKRGGVIGGSAEFSALVSNGMFADDKVQQVSNGGISFLPGAIIDTANTNGDGPDRLSNALSNNPAFVGLRIGSNAALIVSGRRLRTVGDGTVVIRFAASKTYPAKTITLAGSRRFEDLTAMRRYAAQRMRPAFPPTEPAKPTVENGTLVIVGGGMPRGMYSRFVKLAGGKEASIVVIPIASADPLPERDRSAEAFKRAGAKEVIVLRGRTPKTVDRPESLEALRKATGIWFGGGRQWRFVDAYEGTKAAQLMHEVLKRGGVIGGSSAGASIQGDYMARGNPVGNRDIMAIGYERGLGFLPGVAVDQHFTQRKRFRDLSSLVERYPQLLGIGIDEATAIIVKGNVAEVVGRNRVCFYDRNKSFADGEPDYESVAFGGRYDLAARKVLDPGGKKDLEPIPAPKPAKLAQPNPDVKKKVTP